MIANSDKKKSFATDYANFTITQKKLAEKYELKGVEIYYVIGALKLDPRPIIRRGKTTMSKVGVAFQMPAIVKDALKLKAGEVYDWVILNINEKTIELKLMVEKAP